MENDTDLVKLLEKLFNDQNGKEIVKNLDFTKIDDLNTLQHYAALPNDSNFHANFFKSFFQYKQTLYNNLYLAFDVLDKLLSDLFEWMTIDHQKICNWYMPLLLYCLRQYSSLCISIDSKNLSPVNHIHKADHMIKKFFRLVSQNREDTPSHPKSHIYGLTVELFKIYFYTKKYRLCSGLRAQLELPLFPPLDLAPRCHQCEYKFYCGVLDVYLGQYKQARQNLTDSLNLCRSNDTKMKILSFLIPLNAYFGCFPTEQPNFFNPSETPKNRVFIENLIKLVNSVRNGDVPRFEALCQSMGTDLNGVGLVFLVEQIEVRVLRRNAVKNIVGVWAEICSEYSGNRLLRPSQVPLKAFSVVFDEDKVEMVLMNLIAGGMVKGYIATGRCLVISKVDPFNEKTGENLLKTE